MKKCLSILIGLLIVFGLSAQSRVEKIDALVSFCQENNMFNGNILVAEKGKIIYQKSLGLADVEKNIPLNANTSFCLGSISKQFTAFAIMLLVEQGKLAYTTQVGEIFPALPTYMHPITLKQLMQHTSGLRRTHYGAPDGLKNEEIYQNFLKATEDSLLFAPGTELRYSNSGYMLLAMVVEKVAGQSFESFLREKVWLPLGMTNTYVMSEEDYTRPHRAIGFNGFGKKDDFNVLTYGSNGIYSTTEDLFRWTQSFASDLMMDRDDKAEAWKPAQTSEGKLLLSSFGGHKWPYGFGYFLCNEDLTGIVGHPGAYGGFLNIMMHDFENDRQVILLTNNGRIIPITDVGIILQRILRNEPYRLPKISIIRKQDDLA
ncbi:MAG: serine hydrolase domain-containing protein, partial [Bacteroidota bacterium]